MPAGNGTGPMGAGPMTGRATGHCASYATPGFANPVAGGGFRLRQGGGGQGGRGRGMGRGMGMGFRGGRQSGGGNS